MTEKTFRPEGQEEAPMSYEQAMKIFDDLPHAYQERVIKLAGTYNERMVAGKQAEWKARTSEAIKSFKGRIERRPDDELSESEKRAHIVLALKKILEERKTEDYKRAKTDVNDDMSISRAFPRTW